MHLEYNAKAVWKKLFGSSKNERLFAKLSLLKHSYTLKNVVVLNV